MTSKRNSAKLKLRRSFSEQLRSSTSKAWDLLWKNVRERRLAGQQSAAGGPYSRTKSAVKRCPPQQAKFSLFQQHLNLRVSFVGMSYFIFFCTPIKKLEFGGKCSINTGLICLGNGKFSHLMSGSSASIYPRCVIKCAVNTYLHEPGGIRKQFKRDT